MIEYDNSSVRAIRTWHFTCEWNITVKAGRTIKVQIVHMSIQEMSDHSCGNDYLLVGNHIIGLAWYLSNTIDTH